MHYNAYSEAAAAALGDASDSLVLTGAGNGAQRHSSTPALTTTAFSGAAPYGSKLVVINFPYSESVVSDLADNMTAANFRSCVFQNGVESLHETRAHVPAAALEEFLEAAKKCTYAVRVEG